MYRWSGDWAMERTSGWLCLRIFQPWEGFQKSVGEVSGYEWQIACCCFGRWGFWADPSWNQVGYSPPFLKVVFIFSFFFSFFKLGCFFYYYYYYDFRIGLSGWIFLAVLRTMSLKMGVPIILGSSRIWISSWRLWIRRFCRNWMVHLINPPGNKLSWYWILLLQLLYTRETRNILGKHLVYMIWCGTYFKENYQKDWYMSHLKSHLQCIHYAVQCTGYITHTIKPDYF